MSIRQISDGTIDGTILGQSTTDKIGFYGSNAVIQRVNANQAAIAQNSAMGQVTTYSTLLSPAAVASNSTAEQTFTVNGIASTDIITVNKPTAQAGLGIMGVRASAANQIGITFANNTAAAITPTASEVYTVTALKSNMSISATLSPIAVAANTTAEQTFTVAGLETGMIVQVNKPTAQTGLGIVNTRVVSHNTLGITFANVTAAAITPTASEVYTILALNGLNALGNTVLYGVNLGSNPVAVASDVTVEQTFTVQGIQLTDAMVGISKPTTQAGLGIVGARVSAANQVAVNYINVGASATPTASEVYAITVVRNTVNAPLSVNSVALTPTSVAANTTAEQTFTVQGVPANSAVIVNKPTTQAGLGIVGARVSAANTVAITYANVTGTAIVPTAESYTIGNFQTVGVGVNNSYISLPATPMARDVVNLSNELRASLVGLGLIAGS